MFVVLTLNTWGFGHPYDYAVRRGITRGAVPGSEAVRRPITAEAAWHTREALIVDLIRDPRADVVGLQEVGRWPGVLGGRSGADRIADALGWKRLVSLGIDEATHEESGQAILSPRSLEPLGAPFREAPYGCLAARVRARDGSDFAFLTLHLPLDAGPSLPSQRRDRAAARILAWCDLLPSEMPIVVAGDFNSAPGAGAVELFLGRGFVDAGTAATGQPILTMPSHGPVVALDYILVRGAEILSCRAVGDAASADGYYPSDHLGLAAELRASGALAR